MMGEPAITASLSPEALSIKQELDLVQDENLKLLTKLQEIKENNATLSDENEFFKKKYTAIQQETNTTANMYNRLETQLYQYETELSELRQENQALTRSRRDLEKKRELETISFEKERTTLTEKIGQLSAQVKSLQKLKHSPSISRTGTRESAEEVNEQKTPDVSILLKESKILSKTVKSQDRLILELREEIEKAKQGTQAAISRYEIQSLKMAALENEKNQLKQVNQTLMEENESYQVLLHEKTMSGSFMLNPILQNRFDAIEEEDEVAPLSMEILSAPTTPIVQTFAESNFMVEKLKDDVRVSKDENKTLKDENKALTLYINKILTRIMESGQMMEVLASDYTSPRNELMKPSSSSTKSQDSVERNPPPVKSHPVTPLRGRSNTLYHPPTKVSFEETETPETKDDSPGKATRVRRSNSMSASPINGFRAALKRMSMSGWKAGNSSPQPTQAQ
ncbi:hypothetical protein K493DRAFT_311079 [Basidiobolus meristosporus CBS 931.73]|uniref:Uncharacterized protein n=1 Tax=Basidiobolus meristosporus CBS 931.73 TaxID=1314790 RepID=A0A1Y1Z533_9FUNG|nr:hypothetical protein K493DRAFT_311079 [Basidiobolus meristosporus CBS 931.73]|eukprot:ORY05087.1 hypothetical protein K493DRAFT_311079 [Basidiobolus meristosporus CBS 931.73]